VGALPAYGLLLMLVNLMAPPAMAAQFRILAFGDSLTAGYNLPAQDAFPNKLEAALRAQGRDVKVLNGGVSGDTSAGGLARLDWALADKPDLVILELGANDALRGHDPAKTYANLDAILGKLKAKGVPVLLAGIMAPPNLGRDYAAQFNGIYKRLADKHGVPLYPFFLDGVATRADLNLGDGLHPNARGVDAIVRGILPHVTRMLPAQG